MFKFVRIAMILLWGTLEDLGHRPISITVVTEAETFILLEGEDASK